MLQERRAGQKYYVGSAGRAFLRLCAQVYRLVEDKRPLAAESVAIFKMLGIEPYENVSEHALQPRLVDRNPGKHVQHVGWESDHGSLPMER